MKSDKPLLLGRDSFLILNLRLHVLDRVVWFNIERDGFTREGLDEDLHGHGGHRKNVEV